MTIDAHAQAFLDRLHTDIGPPPLNVHDDEVPDGTDPRTDPYVVVYFTVKTPNGEEAPDKVSLTMDSDVVEMSAYCHCVGGSAKAARIVQTRVRSRLLNARVTIAGRVCSPIRHVDNQPPRRDEDTGSLVVDAVDVYRLVTVPA